MSTPRRMAFALVFAALTVFAAACAEAGTEPELDATLDADAALADYEALNRIVAGMRWGALDPLAGNAGVLSETAGSVLEPVAALRTVPGDGPAQITRTLMATLAEAAPARVPLISEAHLGTTFVYDPDAGRYIADPTRTDAPSDGVRFELYEDREDGSPDVERIVGHADLIDQGGDAEGVDLRLAAVIEGETVLDYRTAVVHGNGEGTVRIEGFLAGDDGRLDFDVAIDGRRARGAQSMDLSFRLAVESRGFVIEGEVSGMSDDGAENGDIDLHVRHGNESLHLEATTSQGVVDGEIRFDGELFATIEGPDEDPTVTSADGDALTASEALVVRAVVDTVEDVFDLVEDLIDPMDDLIVAAILL